MKPIKKILSLGMMFAAMNIHAAQAEEVTSQKCRKSVQPLLTAMFSKLGNDCQTYAALYSSEAKYYHQHQGFKTGTELYDACVGYGKFCQDDGNECLFLQNGPAIVTEKDNECHVLAPYIWSQIPADNKIPGNLEPHTGWEYLIVSPDSSAKFDYKIDYFAEIETSYSVPYNWANPTATPQLFQESTLSLLEIERQNGIYQGECDTPIPPLLTSYFKEKSAAGQHWRQQGDAVVLGVGGLCQVAVPYAAQIGKKLQSGYTVLVLASAEQKTYKILDEIVFPNQF